MRSTRPQSRLSPARPTCARAGGFWVRSLAPIALACLFFAASLDASHPSAATDPDATPAPGPTSVPAAVADPRVEKYGDIADRLIAAALASDHAYLRLSQLCDGIGNRLSGSKSL